MRKPVILILGAVVGLLLITFLLVSFYFSPINLFSTSTRTAALNNGFNLTVYVSDVKPEMGDEVEIKIILTNVNHPNATTDCCGYIYIAIFNEGGETIYGLAIKHGCRTGPLTKCRLEPGGQISHTQTWKVQNQLTHEDIQPGRHYLTVSDCFIDLDLHEHFEISIEPIEIYIKGMY
jgi:hypothetical protein